MYLQLILSLLLLLYRNSDIKSQVTICDTVVSLRAEGQFDYVEWFVNEEFAGVGNTIPIKVDSGYISVTAIAYNGNCETKAIRIFKIEPCADCAIYIPNAVTPDGDGVNDTWSPVGECKFRFDIFNRWGELIYSGPPSWDAPVQNDVYVAVVYTNRRRYIGKVVVVR
jgi:hypothetical protein